MIVQCAKETGAIVTAEEHNIIGGLLSAVSETLVQSDACVPVEAVGMPDRHAETGKYEVLLEKFGLNTQSIVEKARAAVARKK